MDDKLRESVQLNKKRRNLFEASLLNMNSKKRLASILQKKFTTSFIAPLALFEEYYGHLWGNNKKDKLTKEEMLALKVWEDIRKRILDNGNAQIRAMEEELEEYSIEWNGQKVEFKNGE